MKSVWKEDGEGIYQEIQMSPEFAEHMKEYMVRLEEKLGRPLRQVYIGASFRANIPAQLIYASLRMDGMMLTSENVKKANPADVEQWEGLVAEFNCFTCKEAALALSYSIRKNNPGIHGVYNLAFCQKYIENQLNAAETDQEDLEEND